MYKMLCWYEQSLALNSSIINTSTNDVGFTIHNTFIRFPTFFHLLPISIWVESIDVEICKLICVLFAVYGKTLLVSSHSFSTKLYPTKRNKSVLLQTLFYVNEKIAALTMLLLVYII